MWEFFGTVVASLPPWFLMALIVFLVAVGLYLLPRVRRDKRGRWYLFSRSYEHQKERVKELLKMTEDSRARMEGVAGDVDAIKKRLSSIECEDFKQSFYLEALPKDERLVAGLKYVHNGGNGQVRKDVSRFVRDNQDVCTDVISRYPQWALPQGEPV
jgi:predicted nuclease with TOPRIM domain